MATLKPKEFIQQVLIDEIKPITISSPYISFALMVIGIEFLGKCISTHFNEWDKHRRYGEYFKKAIEELDALQKYIPLKDDLYLDLRCGFAHSLIPGSKFTLSSKDQAPHMLKYPDGTNLKCEDFYEDFRNACLEVISMTFADTNKMNRDLLMVPGANVSDYSPAQTSLLINSEPNNSASGTTRAN